MHCRVIKRPGSPAKRLQPAVFPALCGKGLVRKESANGRMTRFIHIVICFLLVFMRLALLGMVTFAKTKVTRPPAAMSGQRLRVYPKYYQYPYPGGSLSADGVLLKKFVIARSLPAGRQGTTKQPRSQCMNASALTATCQRRGCFVPRNDKFVN